MKKKKFIVMFFLIAVFISSMFFVVEAKEVVLKLGHCHPTTSEFHMGALKFAELASEKSNGIIKIEVYHSSQLGDEPALSESVRMGTVDMALLATGNVAKFEPKFNIFDLPFLFRDHDHADKVLSGEVAKYLADELEKKGIKIIRKREAEEIEFLKTKGLIINENPDKQAWREATKGVYKEFGKKLGEDL